jgi:cell division transport system ATP-binding protein
VTKTYKKHRVKALDNVSLHIQEGEFVYLMGSSGSGKSTLMKLLYGQEKANKGSIKLGKYNLRKMKHQQMYQLRREVGVVFQDFRLLPERTVYENIAYALEVIETEPDEMKRRALNALEMVKLKHKFAEYPKNLSGGEQQRVAIARAIVNEPKVLLADEPTGNLDPQTSLEIMRILYRINKKGTTILMATHDQEIVDQVPYRVIELKKGNLQRDRSKEHIGLIYNEKMGDFFVV